MQDLGIRNEIVQAVLNHAVPGVGGVYLRAELEKQKADALATWAVALDEYRRAASRERAGGVGVTRDKDKDLAKAARKIDIESLIRCLEKLGGDGFNLLRPTEHRWERAQSEPVGISPAMLDIMVAILRVRIPRKKSRRKRGRPKQWSEQIEGMALVALINNIPRHDLALRLSAMTGEDKEIVRRRLLRLNKSPEVKQAREGRRFPIRVTLNPFTEAEAEQAGKDAHTRLTKQKTKGGRKKQG